MEDKSKQPIEEGGRRGSLTGSGGEKKSRNSAEAISDTPSDGYEAPPRAISSQAESDNDQ